MQLRAALRKESGTGRAPSSKGGGGLRAYARATRTEATSGDSQRMQLQKKNITHSHGSYTRRDWGTGHNTTRRDATRQKGEFYAFKEFPVQKEECYDVLHSGFVGTISLLFLTPL